MRFIHTADWQIGMKAAHAAQNAGRVRAARLESARRVCELARRTAADFLVLAGDTFENNAVDRNLVVEVAQILNSATCPVFVLPGNHDPLQPGSVWEHAAWSRATNITVLRERRPVQIARGLLLPCPLFARRSGEDPTAWIKPERSGNIQIVVAHGNAGNDVISEEGGFPIPLDTPGRTNADYVALGHWHSFVAYKSGGSTRMAYSGTHETTRFGESDSGNALIVTISGPGAAPDIQQAKTGCLRWERVGLGERITTHGKLAGIAHRLSTMPEPDNTLVEVLLAGVLFEEDRDELPRIEKACSRFLHCRLDRSGLMPEPDDGGWIDNLPAGVVRQTAVRLRDMASGGKDAEIATQALIKLYSFAQEVR